MATQIGAIKVQIGPQNPKVQTISYGARTLKQASDLNFSGAQQGDVIAYNAANNSFITTNPTSVVPRLDAGTF